MLKYIGGGDALIGVPARDLSNEEVEELGKAALLNSGLYQEIKTKAKKAAKPQVTK
jgi:hypothetical protein